MWPRYLWGCAFSVPNATTIHLINGLRMTIIHLPLFSAKWVENRLQIHVNLLFTIEIPGKLIIRFIKNRCLQNFLVGKCPKLKKGLIEGKS